MCGEAESGKVKTENGKRKEQRWKMKIKQSTRLLVNLSTRQLVYSSTKSIYLSTRQLVYSSTKQPTCQLIVFIVFSYRRLSDVMCADRHWKLVYRWISAHITLLEEHQAISGSLMFLWIIIRENPSNPCSAKKRKEKGERRKEK